MNLVKFTEAVEVNQDYLAFLALMAYQVWKDYREEMDSQAYLVLKVMLGCMDLMDFRDNVEMMADLDYLAFQAVRVYLAFLA